MGAQRTPESAHMQEKLLEAATGVEPVMEVLQSSIGRLASVHPDAIVLHSTGFRSLFMMRGARL